MSFFGFDHSCPNEAIVKLLAIRINIDAAGAFRVLGDDSVDVNVEYIGGLIERFEPVDIVFLVRHA